MRRYLTADVFTDRAFGGNPVAVVLDAEGLSEVQMQALATEFNYSETTFVLPPRDPSHNAWVRIFTPAREVPFAGHPNVGTAFLLARDISARGLAVPTQLVFEETAGLVTVSLITERGTVIGAEVAAPQPLSRHGTVSVERAAACLSLAPEDVRTAGHAPHVVSVGLPFLVIELVSRAALRRIKPSPAAYADVLPLDGAFAVYAYTQEALPGASNQTVDLQSRMFMLGLTTEDPATGSAAAAVTALLAALRGGAPLRLRISQGAEMGRPSLLLGRAHLQAGKMMAFVGGHCTEMFEGSFNL